MGVGDGVSRGRWRRPLTLDCRLLSGGLESCGCPSAPCPLCRPRLSVLGRGHPLGGRGSTPGPCVSVCASCRGHCAPLTSALLHGFESPLAWGLDGGASAVWVTYPEPGSARGLLRSRARTGRAVWMTQHASSALKSVFGCVGVGFACYLRNVASPPLSWNLD